MLPVFWLPEADAELKEALGRYHGIRPDIARRVGVRRFPYGLYFIVEDTRIVVIACFHGRRNPRRWQLR